MAENKLVSIRKNIKGSLYLVLDDYYGEKMSRTFALTPDKPEIQIPLNFALSIFNSNVFIKDSIIDVALFNSGSLEINFSLYNEYTFFCLYSCLIKLIV